MKKSALSAVATEALWVSDILEALYIVANPVAILEDNRGCIYMVKNLESKRTKHTDVMHHVIRDLVASGMQNV